MSEWQRYTDPAALLRMADGRCPECAGTVDSHTGWSGPRGCGLTDNGVAGRIYQYQQDLQEQVNG